MLKPTIRKLTVGRDVPTIETKKTKADKIPDDLRLQRKAAKRILIDARHEQNAIELIMKLPEEGESVHFVIDGRFQPCDIIPATRRLSHPAVIKRLEITTLGFNPDNVACIAAGMDQGKIQSAMVVCSHYFSKADAGLFELMKQEVEVRGGKVLAMRTHTKLMLMEMSDGRHFTVEGSGNLRACRSIEQFCMTNDRDLLLFHRKWLNDYINGQ